MDKSLQPPSPREVVVPAYRFDAHEAPGFRQAIDGMIEQGVVAIDVNLGDIVLIDSSALAELVRTQRSLHAVGGALRILRPSDSVRVILEVTGLNAIFEISES